LGNKPLVSVIIPAYNHELYVGETLQSVVGQTYPNIEIIIINDGSTDKTGEIIKSYLYKNRHLNINFFEKDNEGISKTLNKGLSMANGEYIAVIASDDLWHSQKIEKQVCLMENNKNIGLVFSDATFIEKDKLTNKYTNYKPFIPKLFKNNIQNTNIYETLLKGNIIPALTVMVRKKCFDDVGVFDENLRGEDHDMWLRITQKYPVGFIDEPLAYYRMHSSNASKKDTLSFVWCAIVTINKQLKQNDLKNKTIKKVVILIKFFFELFKNQIKKYLFLR